MPEILTKFQYDERSSLVRTTIFDIQKMKRRQEIIPVITAYDYTSAQIADRAGIPMIHVGDTLGMVVLGHQNTLAVTLDEMVYHTRIVVRGAQQALVTADMPFLTYTTVEQAVQSAGRLMQEAGAQAVKLEGGEAVVPMVRRLVELGIPVVGHLGYTPQSEHQIGRRVQGKDASTAAQLIKDALALEAAGAFSLVLELVPTELAQEITSRLHIPTIGIGAGVGCDGQVQVWHDVMGLYTDFLPRHSRRYLKLADSMETALRGYINDVRAGTFPTGDHGSSMKQDVLQEALKLLDG
jgi:3-methyl-2-oxobutanoate hydroxymethyltransferase